MNVFKYEKPENRILRTREIITRDIFKNCQEGDEKRREMFEQQRENFDEMEKAVKIIADLCNTFDNENTIDAFICTFTRQHRTIQQGIYSMLLQALAKMAAINKADGGLVDGRNQQLFDFGEKILNDPPYFPMV